MLRARDEPLPSRLDYWQHVLDDALIPTEIRGVSQAKPWRTDKLRIGQLGAVTVTDLITSWIPDYAPAEVVRSPRHIRRSDPDLYKVEIPLSGQVVVEQNGREARLGPGDFALIDSSRPCHWAVSSRRFVFLIFPKTLLPLRHHEAEQLAGIRIAGDRGTGALVSSLTRQMIKQLGGNHITDGARIAAAVTDLVAVALATRLDRSELLLPGTWRQALLLRIQAFIEVRLSDPRLSPSMIAQAHHISVRYLHKLFETHHSTVSAWIRERRLERCRHDLLNLELRSESVSAIAVRWGFTAPAHFSRVFREAYGIPPAEYRRLCI
jgi:AraC-like DNA-binding protein